MAVPTGIEPVLPEWESDVLTARRLDRVMYNIIDFCFCIIFLHSSHSAGVRAHGWTHCARIPSHRQCLCCGAFVRCSLRFAYEHQLIVEPNNWRCVVEPLNPRPKIKPAQGGLNFWLGQLIPSHRQCLCCGAFVWCSLRIAYEHQLIVEPNNWRCVVEPLNPRPKIKPAQGGLNFWLGQLDSNQHWRSQSPEFYH